MHDRRRWQVSLRTLLIATAIVPPYVWLMQKMSVSTKVIVIGLILLVVPELVWTVIERLRGQQMRLPNAGNEGDLTERTLVLGRMRHGRDARVSLLPMVVALAFAVSAVVLLDISLPAIRGLGFDFSEYYRECPTVAVVLPRALPIGMVAGVVAFAVAVQLGERRGPLFAASMLALVSVAAVVALAFLIGNGLPSATYANVKPADVFLLALIPIGGPMTVGALLGGRTAVVS